MKTIKLHKGITEEADSEPTGKHIGALSDLDKTRLTGFQRVLRNALMLPAIVPAAMVGLPVRMLTGSTKKAASAFINTWSQLACAAIGIELRVRGREHLWSHRPAVFIYNHQSIADALIVTQLLERDYAGIAKKEIAQIPVIGTLSKVIGTVFIDRSSSVSARADMEPAVEALREGQSIVIAPEGTRSHSLKIGPFRKGAFHLAMQAGVPIVPIVVHNSIDVAPAGFRVLRPAIVDVEVLPPISTDAWRVETIDQHTRDVRGLFLEHLGQKEEPATAASATVKSDPKKKVAPAKKKVASARVAAKRAKPKLQ